MEKVDSSTVEGRLLDVMLQDLAAKRDRFDRLENYADGDAPLPWGPNSSREVFREFQRKARANWAGLIVEAVRERMEVVGFRTGAQDDELGDAQAWAIWNANNMDSESSMLHRALLTMSEAYATVGVGPDPDTGYPRIAAEDPREVITRTAPGSRHKTVAALKAWVDPTGDEIIQLYLENKLMEARRSPVGAAYVRPLGDNPTVSSPSGFTWTASYPLPGYVPVVRFQNRPNLRGGAKGEFEDVTDDIDRINLMLLQRLSVAVMQAFRQRAAKGLPLADAKGVPYDWSNVLTADPGSVWALPQGVELWESGGVDLTPILESVKADVRDLAATTRTPMFYLFPDAANGSAEGASLQREGLVFKARDRLRQTSLPYRLVMSMAFRAMGDQQRSSAPDMETLWAPPERFSMAERYDAAAKASAAGVPWRTIMAEILQFSPQQIQRMETERSIDSLLTSPVLA